MRLPMGELAAWPAHPSAKDSYFVYRFFSQPGEKTIHKKKRA
jgi:hypothetical protein